MQVILATRAKDRLEDVADQADHIHEVTSRSVNEIVLQQPTEVWMIESKSSLVR